MVSTSRLSKIMTKSITTNRKKVTGPRQVLTEGLFGNQPLQKWLYKQGVTLKWLTCCAMSSPGYLPWYQPVLSLFWVCRMCDAGAGVPGYRAEGKVLLNGCSIYNE